MAVGHRLIILNGLVGIVLGLNTVGKAFATELQGTLTDSNDLPVPGVIYLARPDGGFVGLESVDGKPTPTLIIQKEKSFQPGLIVTRVGQIVRFRNDDPIFHNVFSMAPKNAFDLGLYKGGEHAQEDEVRFKNPGKVDVFCNIHPEMSAVVLVLPHAYYTRSNAKGEFKLKFPQALERLSLHAIDAFGNETKIDLTSTDGTKRLHLVFPRRRLNAPAHTDKTGRPYRDKRPGY